MFRLLVKLFVYAALIFGTFAVLISVYATIFPKDDYHILRATGKETLDAPFCIGAIGVFLIVCFYYWRRNEKWYAKVSSPKYKQAREEKIREKIKGWIEKFKKWKDPADLEDD